MGFPTQENREIRLSGGRENDLVPSTVARCYDFREPGDYLGNVGYNQLCETFMRQVDSGRWSPRDSRSITKGILSTTDDP